MKKNKDKYSFKPLDQEEAELIASIENAEWQQSPRTKLQKRKALLKSSADAFAKKEERINIRISKHDLKSIKMTAAREGMPYQTLIASLIARYNTGALVAKSFS